MNCAQIGEPGSGKSHSLLTILPFVEKTKKPFAIIDVDGKLMDNPEFTKPISQGLFTVFDPGNRLSAGSFVDRIKSLNQPPKQEPTGWLAYGDIVDELEQNSDQFCGAAIDTLTAMEDHIKRFIAFTAKKAKFEFPEWGQLLLSFKELFNYFYSLKLPLKIINMHSQFEKDEFTGMVKLLPHITGSFRDEAGSYPSEFYLCLPRSSRDKPSTYHWRVTPNDRFTARSNVFKGQVEVPQDWRPVWEKLL